MRLNHRLLFLCNLKYISLFVLVTENISLYLHVNSYISMHTSYINFLPNFFLRFIFFCQVSLLLAPSTCISGGDAWAWWMEPCEMACVCIMFRMKDFLQLKYVVHALMTYLLTHSYILMPALIMFLKLGYDIYGYLYHGC